MTHLKEYVAIKNQYVNASWRLHGYCYAYVCMHVCMYVYTHTHTHTYIYRVSQEEKTKLRESVPYVKIYRYNPKHLYPKLNGYGDNGQRSLKL